MVAEMEKVKIIKVEKLKDRREFINYPLRLYKGNENYVPPLYGDEKKLFGNKNIYNKICDSVFFLAKRGKVTVGRIQGIIQKQYNDIHGTKQARFTRFDCEDNFETAKALFSAVENWAREMQMTDMVGPLGYSDLEREGLLVEGFEYLSTFEEQYNYEYYQHLVEKCGYVKDADWIEHRLFSILCEKERHEKIFEYTLKKYNLHIADTSMGKRKYIQKYKETIFTCLDECYKDLYGTVPFTPEMQKQIISQFMLLLDLRYLCTVLDENDNAVAFGLCLPGMGKAVQKTGGKLTPACLIRLLKAVKHPKSIDFGLIGIMPQYRLTGLSVFMGKMLTDMFDKYGVEYMETNLNLEDNAAVVTLWKNFEHIQHKRRRSYKKP